MCSDRRGTDSSAEMRTRIIEALTYPRLLMTSTIDIDNCPMHGYFDKTLDACLVCDKSNECLWLNNHDEFSVLARKPVEALYEAFSFSIDYVGAYVARQHHNPRRCACDTCDWLRDARHLVREYKRQALRGSRR
jgi:hypothetical protein